MNEASLGKKVGFPSPQSLFWIWKGFGRGAKAQSFCDWSISYRIQREAFVAGYSLSWNGKRVEERALYRARKEKEKKGMLKKVHFTKGILYYRECPGFIVLFLCHCACVSEWKRWGEAILRRVDKRLPYRRLEEGKNEGGLYYHTTPSLEDPS